MFDISTVSKRYFQIKLNKKLIEVEPPTLKSLKRIMQVSKTGNEDAMDDLTEAIALILNKNKSGYKVPAETIEEMDVDQMNEILTAYFGWLGKVRNDPN